MRKRLIVAAVTTVVLSAAVGQAENRAGSFNLTPFIGGYTFDGTQDLEPSLLYGLRAGYNFTKNIGLEGMIAYAPTVEDRNDFDDANMLNYRLEALYNFFPESRLVPFLAVGYGGTTLRFDKSEDAKAGVFGYGAGVKYAMTDNLALRADVRHLIIDRGPTVNNYEYTLGLNYQFGGNTAIKPAPAPAPAPVAKPAPVPEVKPAPAPVEPPKPAPAPAPAAKLSVAPETIYAGQPATLSWSSSNTDTCSIDSGVGMVKTGGSSSVAPAASTAYKLVCTGAGGSADSVARLSVIQDSDKDGVFDDKDKCPGTPAGTRVNKDGCPLAVCKKITLDLHFDFDKAEIKPVDFDQLKNVAAEMKNFDTATVALEGHTDSKGSDSYNLKLSQRRAEAVRKYLIEKQGVSAARLTAKGFGEAKPVSTNATDEGRAKNRRVEAVFTCH